MLILRSRSTSRSRGGPGHRPGFTLIELAVGMMIMSVLLVILINAFLGARKSQGQAVSMMGLKMAGSKAAQSIYVELSQTKRLLASMDSAPPEEDIGRSYFARMDIPTTGLKPIPALNMRFPRVAPLGRFTGMGTEAGQLSPYFIGNSLVLVTRATEVRLATPGVSIKFGSFGSLKPLSPEKPVRLNRFRFVAYYLTEELLPKHAPSLNGSMRHYMNLARWESQLYVDKAELEGILSQMPDKSDHIKVKDDLANQYQVVGFWDSAATDASKALFTMDNTGKMVPLNGPIQRRVAKQVTVLNLEPYAQGMVAFNTNPNFKPLDSLKSSGSPVTLQVPQFGETGSVYPYGLEVGIVGSNAARSVLVRLALAARLEAGGNIFGWSHQEIVQLMDN